MRLFLKSLSYKNHLHPIASPLENHLVFNEILTYNLFLLTKKKSGAMSSKLIIYLERLKEGESTEIDETLSPEELMLEDDLLKFMPQIRLEGSAYLAEDHVVLQLDVVAGAKLGCSVCNQDVLIPIELKNTYITKELSSLKGGLFHYLEDLRELILLEAPSFVECNSGNCPEREEISSFLKKEKSDDSQMQVHFPFGDLDEKMKEN